ncbi:RNA-binding protein Musashi Rbp6 [Trichonephila clavata]|uniref:RNA-binding protein Musashi Rbp6 n=1 Tax=Trichonephila clavata TaxID=2740835 RepID=A0A8X6KV49_TRICU|nr:RNA-binding protein Musashi Rbp6 [Trichonephila clavata]
MNEKSETILFPCLSKNGLSKSNLHVSGDVDRALTAAYSSRVVINNYGPQGFATSPSPANNRVFPATNSPGPIDIYTSNQDGVSYVQDPSPQSTGFPPIAVNRVCNCS